MTHAATDIKTFDPIAFGQRFTTLTERLYKAMEKIAPKAFDASLGDQNYDPFNLKPAILEFFEKAWKDPDSLLAAQVDLLQDNLLALHDSWYAFLNGEYLDENDTSTKDKRFRNPLWHTNPYFRFARETYQATAQWMLNQIYARADIDEHTRKKLLFFTQQYLDAIAPSNFPFFNPDVIQRMIDTGGLSILEGIENLIEDIEKSGGKWGLTTTDKSAFKVGKNLAITKGSVIYQNDLMQLIQYAPTTDKVAKEPLLIIPPWINKYYILDMRQDNSFVKWLVDQGHTVFIISWANPTETHRDIDFDDYMTMGVFEAVTAIQKATGEKEMNVIGYCIGGTLLTGTLAYLEATKKTNPFKSATFLTTLVDFENAGDLGVFIDDAQVDLIDHQMKETGYMPAEIMKATFSLLRANDLIWSFVINNYLMGADPFPFDLLFWNDDSVNIPEKCHSFYLRNMYLKNNLIKKDAIKFKDVPLDITKIKTPSYFLSSKEDHIAPWKTTYSATQLFSGDCTFTLAASGHIAGVVNPPSANKYTHWTSGKNSKSPDIWFRSAEQKDGSWWPHWQKWISKFESTQIPARKPKNEIEPAPGSYVIGKTDRD